MNQKSCSDEIQIPADPRTEIAVMRRYLHILALIQNQNYQGNWNGRTLADLLTTEEMTLGNSKGTGVSDYTVRDYIKKNLKQQLGIDIETETGSRKICLNKPLEEELLEKLLPVYSAFVISDSGKEIILKKLIKKQPKLCLWNLATVYFSTIRKLMIEFDYTKDNGLESHYTIIPFYILFRNNNLYLCGKKPGHDEVRLYIFNKLENLAVTESSFKNLTVPPLEDIFKDTLGSFIGKSHQVKIRYTEDIQYKMEDILSILEPKIRKISEVKNGYTFEADFSVSDDIYLCKQLFMYGSKVEIVQPTALRKKMIQMLQESIKVYGDQV